MADTPLVGVVMGSDSDFPIMESTVTTLKKFGIPHEVRAMSAHRSPNAVAEWASSARERGLKVIIAAAGGAAHLGGVVAAHTTLPVVGVPIDATSLNGLDALLATVQMPPGIPVATVAVGKFGAVNAAILAAQILGVADEEMAKKMDAYKIEMAEKVKAKNAALQEKL